MFRSLILSVFCFVLYACGGGSSESNEDKSHASTEEKVVSGVGGTVTVNSSKKTHLVVSGVRNTVNIKSDLASLVISGMNNLLIFSDKITVDSCTVSGSDNTAQQAGSLTMTCTGSGIGNSGF